MKLRITWVEVLICITIIGIILSFPLRREIREWEIQIMKSIGINPILVYGPLIFSVLVFWIYRYRSEKKIKKFREEAKAKFKAREDAIADFRKPNN